MNELSLDMKTCRSHSHELIRHKSNHHRSDSSHSTDLFKQVVSKKNASSLSTLICSICSLPMLKPTLLPCQHTFCFKCIEKNQQIRSGSLPSHSPTGGLSNDHQMKSITCSKCFRTHQIKSLSDLEENRPMELLINTLLCETCHQLYPSNELDTCLHCFGVLCPNCYDDHLERHLHDSTSEGNFSGMIPLDERVKNSQSSSDSQIFQPRSMNSQRKVIDQSTRENENTDPSQINFPKKKSNNIKWKFFLSSRHRHSKSVSDKDFLTKSPSTPIKQSNSVKISRRSKENLTIQTEETTEKEVPLPNTSVQQFLSLSDQYTHTAEYIKQCKQRQSELDLSVKKLIEMLTIKSNENINRISFYWIYLKRLVSEQYESNPNRLQIFDYLFKTCCSPFESRKQVESYFQQNDEINASLQVLFTTITIVHNQQILLTLNQLFDREEQTTIRTLRRQLESLLAFYTDEISFINERIKVYESRFATWRNSNKTDLESIAHEWTQIVEHDYPSFIEKIANDFITKIPQVEKVLVQMLRNMKKRLLNVANQPVSQRTSDS